MNKKNSPITYSSSGVDIEKGNQLVEEIKPIIRETKVPGADIEIGGFGGLFDIMKLGFNDPLLVSSTDGVGTKLLLAIESNNVSGVGIDLPLTLLLSIARRSLVPTPSVDDTSSCLLYTSPSPRDS